VRKAWPAAPVNDVDHAIRMSVFVAPWNRVKHERAVDFALVVGLAAATKWVEAGEEPQGRDR